MLVQPFNGRCHMLFMTSDTLSSPILTTYPPTSDYVGIIRHILGPYLSVVVSTRFGLTHTNVCFVWNQEDYLASSCQRWDSPRSFQSPSYYQFTPSCESPPASKFVREGKLSSEIFRQLCRTNQGLHSVVETRHKVCMGRHCPDLF